MSVVFATACYFTWFSNFFELSVRCAVNLVNGSTHQKKQVMSSAKKLKLSCQTFQPVPQGHLSLQLYAVPFTCLLGLIGAKVTLTSCNLHAFIQSLVQNSELPLTLSHNNVKLYLSRVSLHLCQLNFKVDHILDFFSGLSFICSQQEDSLSGQLGVAVQFMCKSCIQVKCFVLHSQFWLFQLKLNTIR